MAEGERDRAELEQQLAELTRRLAQMEGRLAEVEGRAAAAAQAQQWEQWQAQQREQWQRQQGWSAQGWPTGKQARAPQQTWPAERWGQRQGWGQQVQQPAQPTQPAQPPMPPTPAIQPMPTRPAESESLSGAAASAQASAPPPAAAAQRPATPLQPEYQLRAPDWAGAPAQQLNRPASPPPTTPGPAATAAPPAPSGYAPWTAPPAPAGYAPWTAPPAPPAQPASPAPAGYAPWTAPPAPQSLSEGLGLSLVSLRDLESRLTGRLLAWVGAAAVVLGAAFFLSLAFSRGWIGPEGRVAMGIVGGALFVGAGAWLFGRRQEQLGHVIVAVGLGVVSLSLFAGTRFYSLYSPEVALSGS
ncbi:MAG TPA: DUF2339 domain-containing protein, partial [Candidatus Limnocylindrales bacterium]